MKDFLKRITIILVISLFFVTCNYLPGSSSSSDSSGAPGLIVTGKSNFSDTAVSTLLSGDTVNFEYIDVDTTAQMFFTIQNNGTAELNLSDSGSGLVQLIGIHDDLFTVIQPETGNIAAGSSTGFSLSVTPDSGGLKTAVILLTSNDADNSSYNLSLTAEGGIPDISVTGKLAYSDSAVTALTSGDTIDFEFVGGTPKLMNFTIKNEGTGTLVLEDGGSGIVTITGDSFNIYDIPTQPSPASIPPDEERECVIRFETDYSFTDRTATAVISSNDPDEAGFQLALTGFATS